MEPTDPRRTERGRPALREIDHPAPRDRDSAGGEAPQGEDGPIECGYRNSSDRMVIVRCCGPSQFFLERVVFPFELLSFHCPVSTEIKIWTHGLGGPELIETFHAEELRIEPLAMFTADPASDLAATPWLEAG